jgi:hypothetical protein
MPDIGTAYALQAEFSDRYGTPTDPNSVSGWVEEPDGNVVTVNFQPAIDEDNEIIVGRWEAAYEVTKSGDIWWQVKGTGAIQITGERHFKVRAQHVTHA